MNDIPAPDPRQTQCDELADLLAQPQGLRLARLLQSAGFLASEHPTAPAPDGETPPQDAPRPISIWQPQQVDGQLAFVRPDPLPLGDHYAVRKTLRPKHAGDPRRICFFGESTAAGYLYAPHLTPAQVLESQLCQVAGPESYEVIDLSRTNETLGSLVTTVQSALQLSPDVLVVFVGNNWNLLETPHVSPYVPSVRARQRYAQALREGGIFGPIELAAHELVHAAGRALARIDELARSAAIPVVLVVPEVNLADWQTRQPVVWLPGDNTVRWYELYRQAVEALQAEQWSTAAAAAQQMRQLDDGACPTACRILAQASIGLGQSEQARQACRDEIDSSHYAILGFLSAPQATSIAQEIQRRAARFHGFALVDLPQVFADYTAALLPGRRLFLDYCHLTREGIKVALAAVTAQVLRLSGVTGRQVEWPWLVQQLPDPPIAPQADATAMFGAAVHSAHRLLTVGPKTPLLEYWCRAALDASPGIKDAMLDLIAARSAPCPAVLTAAQQRNIASPYPLTLQHGWQYDYLDADLIQAICTVLESLGRPVRAQVNTLLLAHHRLDDGGLELVHPPRYLWEPLERFYPEVMAFDDLTLRATHRSPWPVSAFCLLCDATRDVALDLTLRLPNPPGLDGDRSAKVAVAVNGQPVGALTGQAHWTRHSLHVASAHLRAGLNKLTLHWPLPPPIGDAARQAAIVRLEQGLQADLHPVFGELFSLQVWAA